MSYTLLSGIAQHSKNPDTFWVPSDAERRKLRPGDCAKLMFESNSHPGIEPERRWVERMWVHIDHIAYPDFRGRLANEPFQPDAFGLTAGDAVVFHARNIVNYEVVR